jgi:hypothetical protein
MAGGVKKHHEPIWSGLGRRPSRAKANGFGQRCFKFVDRQVQMDLLGHITLRPGLTATKLSLENATSPPSRLAQNSASGAGSSQSNEIDPRRMVVITRN